MEEDIKILEEVKRPILATGFERQTKILKAIENLIKEYKKMEETLKDLNKKCGNNYKVKKYLE